MPCHPPRVQVGDVIKLRLWLKDPEGEVIDASGAVSMSITVRFPSGDTFSRTATFVQPPDGEGDGTDGGIEIETLEGELDEVGPNYKYQGLVELVSGKPVHSSVEDFEVFANI